MWKEGLGTIAKASPILADGKLYIGTENTGDAGGKFYIIRPTAEKAEILDQDWLGTPQKSELIIASPIVARGRVYVTSMDSLYAIGPKGVPAGAANAADSVRSGSKPVQGSGPATFALVTPTDVILKPGQSLDLIVKMFDAKGNPLGPASDATWTLENLKGTIANGKFTADAAAGAQAGMVKATIGAINATSRVRVIPDLPWTFDFENAGEVAPPHWVDATGKFAVRDLEGNKVLVKLAENPFAFAKRTRAFFGPTDLSDITIEADVRALEKRRQMGDVGIVAQRYELVLFGAHQRARTAAVAARNDTDAADRVPLGEGQVVLDEARGAEPRQGSRARARQGVAERSARARDVDDRTHRSDRQREGQRRHLCGRALESCRRIRAVLRQHQGLSE